jgi:OOP family OmpA-OmpF porin
VLDALNNIQDDTYETTLLPDPLGADLNESYINPSLILGAGVGFRLSRRVDLNLEYRASWHNTDLIDGYSTSRSSNPTAFNDVIHYPSVSLALKLGKGAESRWWVNPLTSQYENIRQLNKSVTDTRTDADRDGVLDFIDEEPNTAAGATVNTRGITVENQDELLLKVTEELGRLAENVSDLARQNDQKIDQLREQMGAGAGMPVTIYFDYNRAQIDDTFYPDLLRVATFMKQNPSLRVLVSGYTDIRADESFNDKLAARRVDAAVQALTRYFGIAADRFAQEVLGERDAIVPNLPDDKYPKNDGPHYLNRRVVFSVIK